MVHSMAIIEKNDVPSHCESLGIYILVSMESAKEANVAKKRLILSDSFIVKKLNELRSKSTTVLNV